MRATGVSKCLDRKLVIFGFEVLDLLAVFLLLSVLNLIFGQSSLKIFLVWTPSILLAVILKFGKKGKPEKYLVHWIRFQIRPGIYSAFEEAEHPVAPPQSKEIYVQGTC